MELAQLIADIEPARREETEFFLIYRKDCHPSIERKFASVAGPKFGRAIARPARNHDVGHPGGSNMLAASAFMEMTLLKRWEECRNEAFLLFEPDCVPMTLDWIDQLSAEWDRVKADGKEAFGHWHQQMGPDTLHMNGNAVFRVDHYDRHTNLLVGSAMMGWDYFYRERLIEISQDSNLITQYYAIPTISEEVFLAVQKNGQRPALLHGIKDNSARLFARKALLNPANC